MRGFRFQWSQALQAQVQNAPKSNAESLNNSNTIDELTIWKRKSVIGPLTWVQIKKKKKAIHQVTGGSSDHILRDEFRLIN